MTNKSILTTPHLDEDGGHTPHLVDERTSRAMVVAKRSFGLVLALAVVGTVASVVVVASHKDASANLVQTSTGSQNALREAEIEAATYNDTLEHVLQKDHAWGDAVEDPDDANDDFGAVGDDDLDCDDDDDDDDPFDCDDDDDNDDPLDCDDEDVVVDDPYVEIAYLVAGTDGRRLLMSARSGEL